MSNRSKREGEGQVQTRTRAAQKVAPPRRYKVLLHDDDFTTMDFVVSILKTVFSKDEQTAVELMLQVHHNGLCVAGVFPFEIAETKVAQTIAAAQAQEFPFLATMEPEDAEGA